MKTIAIYFTVEDEVRPDKLREFLLRAIKQGVVMEMADLISAVEVREALPESVTAMIGREVMFTTCFVWNHCPEDYEVMGETGTIRQIYTDLKCQYGPVYTVEMKRDKHLVEACSKHFRLV